mgnify:FL=1
MDRKQHLQEFLMEKLKYNTKWHPTVLSHQAHKASLQGLFELDDDRHDNTVKKLLSNERIPLERIMKQHEGNPYRFVHLQRKQRTHYLLAEEFTYWAEQQIPLLILDATGQADHSVRIVTKCLPANLPLGPFKAYPKEFIVSYLLGDQDAVINYLTHKSSNK